MVEFAIILPFFLFLLAGGFSVWEGLHGSVNLTSAARAGALVASGDLRGGCNANAVPPVPVCPPPTPAALLSAANKAVAAINAEEQTAVYNNAPGCTSNCVTVTLVTGPRTGTNEVQVSVQSRVLPAIPGLPVLGVTATATASYEP